MEEPINTSDNQNQRQEDSNISSSASSRKIKFVYIATIVGIFLLILTLNLNYFNILPISTVFPNQFGWLPHKERVIVDNKKLNEKFPQNQSTPTPTDS